MAIRERDAISSFKSIRIVTWNMAYWSHGGRGKHDDAWRWMFDELQPDLLLCQECVPLPRGNCRVGAYPYFAEVAL